MSAFDVMEGQAGDRLIVRWKITNRGAVMSSHFANLAEFFARVQPDIDEGDELDWYEVNGERQGTA